MDWDRSHGLALPTTPEVLPRITERISDLKVSSFIRKFPRHEWDMLLSHLALQNCVRAWVKMVCHGVEGLPRRDLPSLTASSLPFCVQPARHPSSTPETYPQVVWNSRGSPGVERLKSDIVVSI